MDNGRIMKELKELQDGVKKVSAVAAIPVIFYEGDALAGL